MSDAFDLSSALSSSALSSGAFEQAAHAAGQVAGDALQGPALQGALHEALSGMGDVIQHLADGVLSQAADNAADMTGHIVEAGPFDAAHGADWEVMQAEVTHAAATLDATEAHALELMASPNAADQLEGQQLMQQVQHQTEAIVEVLQGQSEAIQSTLHDLHGDAGFEALPAEVVMVDPADAAYDHEAGAHGAGADHVDAYDAGAHGVADDHGGAHAAAEPVAHDATTDAGDHTA